jgi:hypothetical protein
VGIDIAWDGDDECAGVLAVPVRPGTVACCCPDPDDPADLDDEPPCSCAVGAADVAGAAAFTTSWAVMPGWTVQT